MLYFAHGSYVDRTLMQVCCPQAKFIAAARLRDYRLCFPRWSKVRDTAVAGIAPAKGETVWGVLYDLSPLDRDRLDVVEGYAAGRAPQSNASTRVTVRAERSEGMTVEAETHVAVPMAVPGQPSEGYLLLLVRSARALNFPADYVARLQAGGRPPPSS